MKLLDQSAQTNWKFIAIVAFVAVFLAGGILMLIPQFQEQPPPLPQPNNSQIDTSVPPSNSVEGWQTYRSEEFGFEVKYPQDWMYEQNVFRSEPNLVFCPLSLTEVHSGETICKWETGATKPQYEDGMISLFVYDKGVPKPNNPVYHFLGLDSQGNQYYLYPPGNNELIFDQILATFRFVE